MGIWSSCCTNEEKQKEMNMDIDSGKSKDAIYLNKLIMIQSIMRTYLNKKKVNQSKKHK